MHSPSGKKKFSSLVRSFVMENCIWILFMIPVNLFVKSPASAPKYKSAVVPSPISV